MFHFISRIFQTVIFVHTAGNVDQELIEKTTPDYVCMQTNARFVVRAPSFNDSVSSYIKSKKEKIRKDDDNLTFLAKEIPSSKLQVINYLTDL
jgi:hypothetical protein